MQGMTEAEHAKMDSVKEYLNRYIAANENMGSLSELDSHISEDLTNPSIGGRGYSYGSGGNHISGGAGATVTKTDTLSSYSQQQAERNRAIMKEVEDAIALLDVTRGKTIVEKRHIGNIAWRHIAKSMNLSRDTCYKLYRESIFILYGRMVEKGLIKPI